MLSLLLFSPFLFHFYSFFRYLSVFFQLRGLFATFSSAFSSLSFLLILPFAHYSDYHMFFSF